MGSALRRGRTLNPEAVETARKWRQDRIKELENKHILTLSPKERHELRRIKGRLND